MRSVIRIIVAGPPGCGKGTQCEYLIAQYGLVHVSTGDILRGDLAKRNVCVPIGLIRPLIYVFVLNRSANDSSWCDCVD